MLQNDKKYKDSTDTNISKNTTNVAFYPHSAGVFTVIAFHIYICYSEYADLYPASQTGHFLYSSFKKRGFTRHYPVHRAYRLAGFHIGISITYVLKKRLSNDETGPSSDLFS